MNKSQTRFSFHTILKNNVDDVRFGILYHIAFQPPLFAVLLNLLETIKYSKVQLVGIICIRDSESCKPHSGKG